MFTPHIDLQVEVAAETEHKRLQHNSENYREDGGEGEQTAGQQVRHCTSCVYKYLKYCDVTAGARRRPWRRGCTSTASSTR